MTVECCAVVTAAGVTACVPFLTPSGSSTGFGSACFAFSTARAGGSLPVTNRTW